MEILEKDLRNTVRNLLSSMNAKAVIFSLEGTLIDNNAFHLIAWKKYPENIGNYDCLNHDLFD